MVGAFELLFIVIALGVVLLVLGGVIFLVVMLVKKSGNNSSQNIPVSENDSIAAEKKEILEMLARKEISKEEAEKKLSELGSPVKDQQQIQSKQKGKNNMGCLIVIILGVLLIPVILIILFLLFATLACGDSSRAYYENNIHEVELQEIEMRDMDSSSFRDERDAQPVRVDMSTDPKEKLDKKIK